MPDNPDPLGNFLQGLVGEPGGAGFYGGYTFRQGIAERKRQAATEQENLAYQRALRLRQDVAAQLDQRVREGQIAGQERAAEEYQYNLGRRPIVEQQQQAKSEADLARETAQTRYYEAQAGRAERTPVTPTHVPGSLTENQQLQGREQQAEGALQGFFLRYPKFKVSRTPPQDMLQFLRHAGYGDLPEGTLYGIIQRMIQNEAKAGGGGARVDLGNIRLPGQ